MQSDFIDVYKETQMYGFNEWIAAIGGSMGASTSVFPLLFALAASRFLCVHLPLSIELIPLFAVLPP